MPRQIKRYGWIPDLPDHRDYLYAAPAAVLQTLPLSFDLTAKCPPVYDQGQLGSCTANAIAGAIEFDQMKQQVKVFIPSRLFIYYNERAMEGTINSDSGAMIRDGIKSVANQGGCPEDEWPYDITKFQVQPPGVCYQDALQYKVVLYQSLVQSLVQMKGCLASGYPFVFGFTVYESFESQQVAQTGHAPMPALGEVVLGGHAVLAVGYDDASQWFIVRNSWGVNWGMKGYFTLPYAYLTDANLASDFWMIQLVTDVTALYRLYHATTGAHFYTTSAAERDNAVNQLGYQSEGTACYVYSTQATGTTDLYRLYRPASDDHFYTTSAAERDNAVAQDGYQSEGTACYVYSTQATGTTALYRLFNPQLGVHFYTTSAAERDNAVAQDGYQSEGTACYVYGA